VLHVDLDEFIAAVEVARRPERKSRWVGGAGDPTQRRTASCAARVFGIHSGMPPEAPGARRRCSALRRPVLGGLRRVSALRSCPWWSSRRLTRRSSGHAGRSDALAAQIRRAVSEATGLSCSVGTATANCAKLATSSPSPPAPSGSAGYLMAVMGDRPTNAWHGRKTARRLTTPA
jgi:DNA polymerase-4